MKRQWVLRVVLMVCVIWAAQDLLWAQQAPDTILYNGKIVTVDNHEVNEDLGTLAQALAIWPSEAIQSWPWEPTPRFGPWQAPIPRALT